MENEELPTLLKHSLVLYLLMDLDQAKYEAGEAGIRGSKVREFCKIAWIGEGVLDRVRGYWLLDRGEWKVSRDISWLLLSLTSESFAV